MGIAFLPGKDPGDSGACQGLGGSDFGADFVEAAALNGPSMPFGMGVAKVAQGGRSFGVVEVNI